MPNPNEYLRTAIAFTVLSTTSILIPAIAGTETIQGSSGCVAYINPILHGAKAWLGGCKGGLAEGKGKLDYEMKSVEVIATFSSGYLNGDVIFKSGNASGICAYVQSVQHGKCWSRDSNSDMISYFVNGDETEGYGHKPALLISNDKAKVSGEFFGGQLHGFGTLSWQTGFKDDMFNERTSGLAVAKANWMVATGLWEHGTLKYSCPSKKSCDETSRRAERAQDSRQNSKLCEAQKLTCIASCPLDRVYTTQPDMNCKNRCQSISCN